jgi:DNA-dependent RNA polymerase auxiliary subunit epsilon
MYKFIFGVLLVFLQIAHAKQRTYITGNGFKACADYCITSTTYSFDPTTIPEKSIIYVSVDFLETFFTQVLPSLKKPIILLSHNGDYSAPAAYKTYLDDPRIIIWFGQNCDITPHPKFFPIPIGIANHEWAHGNPKTFDTVLDILDSKPNREKTTSLYINFSPGTNPVRGQLCTLFNGNPFATFASRKQLREYLTEMAQYRYVLSPFGNGLDCHRTWEALLVGAIPVVKTSTLDPLYKDLPVIIVNDWDEVTPENLDYKYQEMQNKAFVQEKLFMDYWLKLIISYKA